MTKIELPPLPPGHLTYEFPDGAYSTDEMQAYATAAVETALASPEVQALRDALEKCRFALEPYDDIKPRDWVTDRQNLRSAHQAARAALAAMEEKP